MTDAEALLRLVDRATKLIDDAGGGDWNREESDWQLRAAEWKRDRENLTARPGRFVLEDDLTPMQAALQAMGAASMCWENPGGAGIFDAEQASRIAQELVSWLRRHPADDTKDLVARAWRLLRRVPEGTVLPPWELDAHQLGADIAARGWVQRADPEQVGLALDDTQRWPAVYSDPDGGMADRLTAYVSNADTVVAPVVDDQKRPMLPASYPRAEPVELAAAADAPDLGDDPDGDVEGYDGPAPGEWCEYNGANPHPTGSRPGCVGCHPLKPLPDHSFPADQVDPGGARR